MNKIEDGPFNASKYFQLLDNEYQKMTNKNSSSYVQNFESGKPVSRKKETRQTFFHSFFSTLTGALVALLLYKGFSWFWQNVIKPVFNNHTAKKQETNNHDELLNQRLQGIQDEILSVKQMMANVQSPMSEQYQNMIQREVDIVKYDISTVKNSIQNVQQQIDRMNNTNQSSNNNHIPHQTPLDDRSLSELRLEIAQIKGMLHGLKNSAVPPQFIPIRQKKKIQKNQQESNTHFYEEDNMNGDSDDEIYPNYPSYAPYKEMANVQPVEVAADNSNHSNSQKQIGSNRFAEHKDDSKEDGLEKGLLACVFFFYNLFRVFTVQANTLEINPGRIIC